MSIYTRITDFITYKKPEIITVCIIILSYLYVKYALLQACMFKNSLKQLCLYVYMDCTAIKHSRVYTLEQGPGNDFYLGGALVIRKMKFSKFSKFLLYKTPILGGARAPPAPPGPPPLIIEINHVSVN